MLQLTWPVAIGGIEIRYTSKVCSTGMATIDFFVRIFVVITVLSSSFYLHTTSWQQGLIEPFTAVGISFE